MEISSSQNIQKKGNILIGTKKNKNFVNQKKKLKCIIIEQYTISNLEDIKKNRFIFSNKKE